MADLAGLLAIVMSLGMAPAIIYIRSQHKLKERQLELDAKRQLALGPGTDEAQKLVDENRLLRERVENLESIVCSVDFELNQKLAKVIDEQRSLILPPASPAKPDDKQPALDRTATAHAAPTDETPALPAAGSSFYTAMRLLPKERREAMYAVYAFCRSVDDVADDGGAADVRAAELDRWRADIDGLYAGRPAPRVRDLVVPVERYDLKRADFHAVIDGMAMDAFEDIVEAEHRGDKVTHEIIKRLNTTFVTPIDREDIYGLATQLDDIVDFTEEAADFLGLYQVEAPMDQAFALTSPKDGAPHLVGRTTFA